MALNIGDTIGDYQIAGILGAGGMGKVYKVRNTISDRVEAMKVLLPDLANEPELGDRFTREIKLLASLNHPNIAALHTALRIENQLLMVMEFVEGRTLEDRLKTEGRLPIGEAVDAMIQVLAALGYAHERGVVHRDIKPANMMEMPDGAVKLMDFGIAKAAADRRLTMTGTTLGSLYYMSPEQVKGSASLDGRSDIYSVGVSFYELITGTRPFKGDSDYSIMVAHLEQNAKPPIEIDPSLPPDLNEIIMTAIQKDAGSRFQTAQAFRAALESIRPALPAGKPAAARMAATAAPAAAPMMQPLPPPIPTVFQQQAQQAPPMWAQQPAPVAAAPVPPQTAAPKSRRGLWIALGGLMVVAVLAVAAFQLPRFLGTSASEPEMPPVETQQPSGQPAQAAAESQAPASEPAAQPGSGQTGQSVQPAAAPVSAPAAAAGIEKAVSAPVSSSRRQTPAASRGSAAAMMVAGEQPSAQPAAPSQPASAAPAPSQPAQAAPDSAALAEVRERLRMMSSRANAANRTLKTLEAQQQASGLGLRGDISAAWDRASDALEEARAAVKAGDAAAAKAALDTAERDLDRLDKFLGR